MKAQLGTKKHTNEVVIAAIIEEYDTIEEATAATWDGIQAAYGRFPDANIHLYVDIHGHQNEHGGYTEEMHRYQIDICLSLLSVFVGELTIKDLISQDCQSITIDDLFDEDKLDDNDYRKKMPDIPNVIRPDEGLDDQVAEEIVNFHNLKATYDSDTDTLCWAFERRSI